jgi:hypothetical protein
MLNRIMVKSGFLLQTAYATPVYLVSETTMDRVMPPKKMHERVCTREILDTIDYGEDFLDPSKIDEIFEKLSGCKTLIFRYVGAYVQRDDGIDSRPHILICPGRLNASKKAQFNNLFLEVLFHEFTHAYIKSGSRYSNSYYEIIEESLCEAVALSKFTSEKELSDVLGWTSDPRRPLEYTGYTFWSEAFKVSPVNIVVNDVKYYRPIFYIAYGGILYTRYLERTLLHILHGMPPHKTEIEHLYKAVALEILTSS